MYFKTFFVFLLANIYLTECVIQELTIFSEPDCQGDAIIFRSKRPNLETDEINFINQSKSYKVIGWWQGYTHPNYGAPQGLTHQGYSGSCTNYSVPSARSLRFFGTADTSAAFISFFQGIDEPEHISGTEFLVTGLAGQNFGFTPTGLVLSNAESWIGYADPEFMGEGICFINNSTGLASFDLKSNNIQSVTRDCNAKRVVSYKYATDVI
ncbi:uncharacterized protein LOC110857913 [Folsomia candida]|uniref:Uncharacterized protein n=1 Tax=Folsomia candida TaxID=158441 RepID=A0A226DHZ7_FOLCA|nr:uncharacterized protein LOC110857913 [Folsomia candida]OXA44863.1 hypothetical protein Fcan01_20494 [Folsomia candida]